MANPYEAPAAVVDDPNDAAQRQFPERAGQRRSMQVVGAMCLGLSALILLYTVFVAVMVVRSLPSLMHPPQLVLIFIGMMVAFGLGWGALGVGILIRRKNLALAGAATTVLSFVCYVLAGAVLV
jgi:hypothetical protein